MISFDTRAQRLPFMKKCIPRLKPILNRAVATTTGETVSTIASMGLVPMAGVSAKRQVQAVDWDDLGRDV